MITKSIVELNKIFNLLNKDYFEGKLIEPIILIQTKVKKHTLGTCSIHPIWEQKNNKNDKRYEITLSGAYLNRTLEEIVTTLLHEMIHLHCSLNGIKDTSNNFVYHNKKFKEEAEKHGLLIEKGKTVGWSYSKPNEKTIGLIKTYKIDDKAFNYWRNVPIIDKPKTKTKLNKYECPNCLIKISSSKILNIICGHCNKKFELKEE